MPFIFSRRYIQSCLHILRAVLTTDQYTTLVARLNRKSPDRLPAMWEAVVLTCFANLPDFKHEEPLESGRQPDFQFQLPNTSGYVVGDITCVSDKGAMKDNPINLLIEDIDRIARKFGSDQSQFHVQVGADNLGEYHKRRVVLKLPKEPDRQRFLREELTPYINARLGAEDYGHKQVFKSDNCEIEVTFKPKSQFASYGHPSFTSVLHIDRNPVWTALVEKADLLRHAGTNALRLLIICDGGCSAMCCRSLGSGIGRDEIVGEFLRRRSSIDIVIMVTVTDNPNVRDQTRRASQWSWLANKRWLRSDAKNPAAAAELQLIINDFIDGLPTPASNAQSAMRNCLNMDYGIGAWGGYTMTGNKFEISARTLQRVLAGEISIEEFNREYGQLNGNYFARALSNGQTISNISMSRKDERDDDYVEITFSTDAAISPFK